MAKVAYTKKSKPMSGIDRGGWLKPYDADGKKYPIKSMPLLLVP